MATIAPVAGQQRYAVSGKLAFYYFLFFLSGFPALIYQIVWQRCLFTLYGVNIQSVTIIVTIFMMGLGLGSLAGGWLSKRRNVRLLIAFGIIELLVGTFGFASLWIFHQVAAFTASVSTVETGAIAFGLLLIPTLLMGSTLPLLVEYFVRHSGNTGQSVGALYSVNTLGSGVACLAAAVFLMRHFGEAGSVRAAVCVNFFVGITALILQPVSIGPSIQKSRTDPEKGDATISFWIGMLLAAATGFIALAYEIVWYRMYSFTSGSAAPCFAMLLAFYLFGIGYGSFAVQDACKTSLAHNVRRTLRSASEAVLLGSVAAFLVGPVLARVGCHIPYPLTYPLLFPVAALLGSAFPLLAHAAIGADEGTGRNLSFLYMSNIIGSTLGSFLIGFVILNYWSMRATSILLLGLGLIIAGALAILAGREMRKGVALGGFSACAIPMLLSGPLFSGMYERLLYKRAYTPGMHFAELVENRNGGIAVDPSGTVFGEGVYDGRFNTDLVHDTNALFRAFAVAGLHPNPKNILVIGLSSGSWAQVVANDPDVKDETVVEINPGYLPLIRRHTDVSSLLENPKVHIVIDDGRRWLVSHPDRKFDFILMNTTFNWRANASNLLSAEFMGLIRAHLNSGGIAFYNTTSSPEAMVTGLRAFPYGLRLANFVAVSDSPFSLDKDRWRAKLENYHIDGRPVFDFENAYDRQRFDEVPALADDLPNGMLESRESVLARYKDARSITDDNMGTEWR